MLLYNTPLHLTLPGAGPGRGAGGRAPRPYAQPSRPCPGCKAAPPPPSPPGSRQSAPGHRPQHPAPAPALHLHQGLHVPGGQYPGQGPSHALGRLAHPGGGQHAGQRPQLHLHLGREEGGGRAPSSTSYIRRAGWGGAGSSRCLASQTGGSQGLRAGGRAWARLAVWPSQVEASSQGPTLSSRALAAPSLAVFTVLPLPSPQLPARVTLTPCTAMGPEG